MSKFIVIEGIEGAGKSTMVKALADLLESRGHRAVCTREPGGTALGLKLRRLLLEEQGEQIDPLTELLLFAADRAQHVYGLIRPALAQGQYVVCDRFTYSTLAYQGYGRGLPLDRLRMLNSLATGDLVPDLVFLMDLDPAIGLKRVKDRGRAPICHAVVGIDSFEGEDRFERLDLIFHEKVREGFLDLAALDPNRFCVLDATKSPEVLANEAALALIERLL